MIVLCKTCGQATQPHIDTQQLLQLLMGNAATIHFGCGTCGKEQKLVVEMVVQPDGRPRLQVFE